MKHLLKRYLRPWVRPWRDWRAFRTRRSTVVLDLPGGGGRIETCSAGPDGIVSVAGWTDDLAAFAEALVLVVDGERRPPSQTFRVSRPEIDWDSRRGFKGAVAEWVIDGVNRSRSVSLLLDGQEVHAFTMPAWGPVPYVHLHQHPQILGRQDIYGFGMPVHVVSAEVLQLARQLPQPILDFGCGGGALVRALRREGIEAYGLEIDDDRIRTHLIDEVRPWVTLYDGRLPSPFGSGQFASVTCSEVLEHVPDPHAVVAEMARVGTTTMLVTVPDSSGIPRGFPHAVVPWHLLESTHVNFFTHASLAAVLAPHAARVEMSRLGLVVCDRMQFYTSLAAVAHRRDV